MSKMSSSELEELKSRNEELQADLDKARKYAQQCEDECVDLRRQVYEAIKELSKLKKANAAAPPTPANSTPTTPASSQSQPATTSSVRSSRRAGLRSSSKLLDAEPCLDLESMGIGSAKRKAASSSDAEAPMGVRKTKRRNNKGEVVLGQELFETLMTIEAGWSERIDALQQVRDLVNKCTQSGLQLDDTFLKRLGTALSVQVLDPRSQVVKEVCSTTSGIAEAHPLRFCADDVMTSLWKLTYVTIKAISEPAIECIDALVKCLPASAVMPHLSAASTDTHAQARAKAASCMCIILSTNKSALEHKLPNQSGDFQAVNPLEPHKDVIKDIIVQCLNDVDITSRTHGKTAYALLKEQFPALAQVALDQVNAKMRGQLEGTNASSSVKAGGAGKPWEKGAAASAPTAGSSNRIDIKAMKAANKKKMEEDGGAGAWMEAENVCVISRPSDQASVRTTVMRSPVAKSSSGPDVDMLKQASPLKKTNT